MQVLMKTRAKEKHKRRWRGNESRTHRPFKGSREKKKEHSNSYEMSSQLRFLHRLDAASHPSHATRMHFCLDVSVCLVPSFLWALPHFEPVLVHLQRPSDPSALVDCVLDLTNLFSAPVSSFKYFNSFFQIMHAFFKCSPQSVSSPQGLSCDSLVRCSCSIHSSTSRPWNLPYWWIAALLLLLISKFCRPWFFSSTGLSFRSQSNNSVQIWLGIVWWVLFEFRHL